MLLSDMGAEVISVERPGVTDRDDAVCMRGRRSIALNLKRPESVAVLLDLCETADVVFEGFRPGVAERLGIGPEDCMGRNPGLIYGRMTGWGQDGPLANTAGHDINYISLSGALHAIGRKNEVPLPPLNLVGDYGGGGMVLAFGILSALVERNRSGKGQIIDASMVEGSALLMSVFYGLQAKGLHSENRGSNLLDSGAPFYEVYETRTDAGQERQFISIGPLEPQFYQLLLETIGADPDEFQPQHDQAAWPQRKQILRSIFRSKTRYEWRQILEGTDACFAPVLSMPEAADHPQNISRSSFVKVDGVIQPAPAPKFSRTQPNTPRGARDIGQDGQQILYELGYSPEKVGSLKSSGAVVYN
jgi:alpha-methylacyl-CoA racemase